MTDSTPIPILGVYFQASMDKINDIEFITPDIIGFKFNADNPGKKFDLSFFACEQLIILRPEPHAPIMGSDLYQYVNQEFYIEGKSLKVYSPDDPIIVQFMNDIFEQYGGFPIDPSQQN